MASVTSSPFHKEAMLVQASSYMGAFLVLVSTDAILAGILCHRTELAPASNSLAWG